MREIKERKNTMHQKLGADKVDRACGKSAKAKSRPEKKKNNNIDCVFKLGLKMASLVPAT